MERDMWEIISNSELVDFYTIVQEDWYLGFFLYQKNRSLNFPRRG